MRRLIASLFFLAVATAQANTLEQQIAAITARTPATVGVAALDLESGRRVSVRGDEPFPMGSVFKFPTSLVFLRAVDAGKFSLDREVTIPPSEFAPGFSPIRDQANGRPVTLTWRAILAAMLRDSDNTAADFTMPRLGGPAVVTKRLREWRVSDMRVDRSERQMADDLGKPGGVARFAIDPRDTSTPNAALELLLRFQRGNDGLEPASHALAIQLMADSTTGLKRMKAELPAGTIVAHKTGTMPGTANDIGIITSPDGRHHILMAIFTKAATNEDLGPRESAIASIAKVIYDDFTNRK